MSTFDNATLMITGGTGSFGSTVLKHFLDSDLKEIRIFSRDEKKQDDMRHELQAKHPEAAKKVKFYIGDVRNPQSIKDAMPGVDYIFHAAALKQVPSCEFFPMQAVQTNIIGTDNVLHAAIEAGVKRVVCLSTDKAAYPINAMGISKAMMEHVIFANARVAAERGGTTICCTRYGNVMCSRGSVIPLFIDQIKVGNPITITDPNMTRFLMNLDEAVDLVMFAFQHGNPGDLFIQKSDASTIGDLAKAVQQLFGDTGTNIIGTRHGEKLFETLMTREERLRSEDMGHYFRVAADNRDLNYDKFVVKGEVHTMADESYTSHNTNRLDVEGTVKKIMTTEYVQNELKGMVTSENYVLGYKASLIQGVTPGQIRERMEKLNPDRFRVRKFGVSDVIVTSIGGKMQSYYVNPKELIKFNGFFTKLSNGEYLLLNEQGYQVEGQKGTWTVTDEKTIDEQRFVLMVNDQKPDLLPSIVVQSDGKFITSTASGFDNATVRKVRELLHHEKFLENGTAERARESGTEQNYNMIDGCVNNVPKKPRVIGGRVSVLDRLHIKQAERARKDNAQVQQQERTRKN